jgi:hypothetical protein
MTPKTARRLVQRTRRIQGWLSPGAISLLALLDDVQKTHGITGHLFEIGVHHGKSAVVLGTMARQGIERLGVCDIFGAQTLNVSASGRGDRAIFADTFRSFFHDDGFLTVHEKRSTALTVADLEPCRLVHIDGGHTSPEVFADLELAAAALVDRGVIVLDDAFHPSWPGVTDAVYRFLQQHPGRFAPLVVGFNKMVIVRAEHRALYGSHFEDPERVRAFIPKEPYSLKRVELAGERTFVFYVHSSRSERSLRTKLHGLLARHPRLGRLVGGMVLPPLRALKRALGSGRPARAGHVSRDIS